MHYLKGLNTLRFFAALLVLAGHARHDLEGIGVSHTNLLFLHRGADAVQFFFTLSGFLLTYLSLNAVEGQGRFNSTLFYRNRVLRIWPLYYACVAMGFALLGWLMPLYTNYPILTFTVKQGLPWYLFFLPNYIVAAHPFNGVGALYALWSIGVEEQFYLFFPLLITAVVKSRRPLLLVFCITAIYSAFYYLNFLGYLHFGFVATNFINTLKFHFMFIGCFFGVLYKYRQPLVQKLLPDTKITQVVLLVLVTYTVFWDVPVSDAIYGPASAMLYACFIINTFSANRQLVKLETPLLSFLGKISYGIYMFHPYLSYGLRYLVTKYAGVKNVVTAMPWLYYAVLLLVTVLVANLSYKYFESFFLRLKPKKIYHMDR